MSAMNTSDLGKRVIVQPTDGEPIVRVRSCAGTMTTDIAYAGLDQRTLYITEAEAGTILMADMPVAGRPMFG